MDLATARTRLPLSRARILAAALRYIDVNGLAALSMHKLGAELGVKAMSLYNHVDGKDDVLDGVVDLLWQQVENAAPTSDDWQAGYRACGHALWDVISGHPNAGPLITSRQVMPTAALRLVRDHIAAAVDAGIEEKRAYALLRAVHTFALGQVLAQLNWAAGDVGCTISTLLAPDVPADLAGVAEIFCGQWNPRAEFELGLDLMLRGIDAM